MKKITRIVFILLFVIGSLYAKSGREAFMFYKNLDWSFFFDELKVDFDICACEVEDANQWPAGFKAHMVEPIGFIEGTNAPWHFPGLGLTLDKSFLRKQGVSRDTEQAGNFKYTHFILFPVLGWTIGLIQDFWCFERGTLFNLAYLAEVIPSHNNDLIALAEETAKPVSKIWFDNPVAELACSADCVSSSLGHPLDSLYWCDGCRGSVSASDNGFARTGRPYEDTESIAFRMLDRMHTYGGMLKTKESFFAYNPAGSNLKSTLCQAKYFPVIIKDQYFIQMAKGDKSWDAEPFGKLRYMYDFKSTPTDGDDSFFWLWRARDMCVGAMKCRSTFTGL
ncbi:TraU family protein [Sulfurimonas sp.]